jgi:hypothetical protein
LPDWLTGKLSDFAGLIVAPVLLATLVRAEKKWLRAACFSLVVIPFCAIKLAEGPARLVEAAMGALGVSWRIWSDPTDLIALLVLPIAWHARVMARAGRGTFSRRSRETLAVIAGCLACVATSDEASTGYRTSVYLMNLTREPISVQLYRARRPLTCEPSEELVFEPADCWKLGPQQFVPLDADWEFLQDGEPVGGPGGSDPPCERVVLRIDGMADTMLAWGNVADVDVIRDWHGFKLEENAIYIERAGSSLRVVDSFLATATPLAAPLPDFDCAALPEPAEDPAADAVEETQP